MILSQLGIFGWSERDETLVLSSLLTGDPLLLIGNHGGAKTHLAAKLAQAQPIRVFVNPGCPAAWV
jgi:MoxR-like ATPase